MGDSVNKLKSKFDGTSGSTAGQVYVGSGRGKKTIRFSKSKTEIVVPSDTISVSDLKESYYSDPTVESKWLGTLKKYGFGDVDPIKAQKIYEQAQSIYELSVNGAADWYQNSDGKRLVTPEQYLQWYAKNQKVGTDGGPSTSVQKYLFQPEEIQSLIDDTLKSVLGRKATESENKEFYTAIQDMINKGTVTVTKKVGGKTVTETTPGYTKEKAQAVIKKSLEQNAPQDVAEKQSLDFADFLSGLGG